MSKELAVFTVLGSPRSFMGELVSCSDTRITLKNCLMFVTTMDRDSRQPQMACGAVEYASRESVVSINTSIVPGILVTSPDPDLIQHYEKEIVASYSKLTLV